MAEDGAAPRVSVVMPVYNHEAFLWSACHSVLEQDYENLQLIAMDDGSTDSSAFDSRAGVAQLARYEIQVAVDGERWCPRRPQYGGWAGRW